jgi:hypothetical protein
MQKFHFHYKYNNKIHNLLISLESLNLHISPDFHNKYVKNNSINRVYLNEIYTLNTIKKTNVNILIIINNLYKAIHQTKSYKIIQIILKEEKLLNQYMKKFNYIYLKKYNKYQSYIINEKTTIYNIAIMNLYIIYLINKRSNLYYLIYYLLT